MNADSAMKEVVKLTQDLVRIKSVNPPGDELPAAELLAERLKSYGMDVEVVNVAKNRANVVATLRGRGDSSFMFNGHLDVVPIGESAAWERDPFCGDIVDGKVFGRGSSDMKGGVAAAAVAAALIASSGRPLRGDLVITAVSGEETDSIGARHYVEHNSLEGLEGIIIPESTDLDMVVAAKGTVWLELTTFGKTAHSTQPHVGVNAVEHMMALLGEVKDAWNSMHYEKDPYLSPPTINIATISGGVKTNSIPDRCVATVDFRPVPSQTHASILREVQERIAALSRSIPNFRAEVRVINERQPVSTDLNSDLIRKTMELGPPILGKKEMIPFGVNFFTDAAIFATKSRVPMLVLGPGEYDLRRNIYLGHQPNEYVRIENLERATRFFYEISRAMLQQ